MPADRSKCAAFMALHRQPDIFVMPNPWDIGSTRLMEGHGFPALATSSSALAFTLGLRDAEMAVSRDLAIAHATHIAQSTALPVSADLENGFGHEPIEVRETVLRAIDAGLAGCSIEDFTTDPAMPLYPVDDAIERIVMARQTIDETGLPFVLTIRCEAYLYDVEDPFSTVMTRLPAYADAGADVVYAPGMTKPAEIEALVREVDNPVNHLGGSGRRTLSVSQLQDLGVKRISLGSNIARAAQGAMLRAMQEITADGTFRFAHKAANHADIDPFLGMED
jgi:2-methylisocitrate lyase-like PEP mutase family enzyme